MMAAQSAEPTPHKDLWSGIAGIGAAAFLITGMILAWRTPDTGEKDAVRDVLSFYSKESNQDLSEAGALILLAAALLFMFFLVALARMAGNRSHLVLVGGAVFTVSLMVAAIAGNIFGITAKQSEAFHVIPATSLIAILLLDVAYGALIGAMAGAAVVLFAIWRVAQTTDTIPAWLGWSGFVVAVLSLAGPFSAWLTPMLLAVWMLAAGLLMVVKATRGDGAAAEAT